LKGKSQFVRLIPGSRRKSQEPNASIAKQLVEEDVALAAIGTQVRAIVHLDRRHDPRSQFVANEEVEMLLSDFSTRFLVPKVVRATNDICQSNFGKHDEAICQRPS